MRTNRVLVLTIALGSAVPAVALPQALGVLRGRVLADSTQLPLTGAVVSLPAERLAAVADTLGWFRITGIPSGRKIVLVRRIGFEPSRMELVFAEHDTLEADFLLVRRARELSAVQINVVAPPPPKLSEFERRRATGIGRFLTQAVIEKHAERSVSEVLALLPGVRLIRSPFGGGANVASARDQSHGQGGALSGGSRRSTPCLSAIVLDGAFVYQANGETPFDVNSIRLADVVGIEFYRSAAEMPAEYNGTRTTCGLLVLWTK